GLDREAADATGPLLEDQPDPQPRALWANSLTMNHRRAAASRADPSENALNDLVLDAVETMRREGLARLRAWRQPARNGDDLALGRMRQHRFELRVLGGRRKIAGIIDMRGDQHGHVDRGEIRAIDRLLQLRTPPRAGEARGKHDPGDLAMRQGRSRVGRGIGPLAGADEPDRRARPLVQEGDDDPYGLRIEGRVAQEEQRFAVARRIGNGDRGAARDPGFARAHEEVSAFGDLAVRRDLNDAISARQ